MRLPVYTCHQVVINAAQFLREQLGLCLFTAEWFSAARTLENEIILFGKTWPAHSSATQATEINTLGQITGKVIDVSRTHIPLKALMIPLKRVKLRGVV